MIYVLLGQIYGAIHFHCGASFLGGTRGVEDTIPVAAESTEEHLLLCRPEKDSFLLGIHTQETEEAPREIYGCSG